MHETMVAQGILEAIIAEADRLAARPVAARISCGQLNPVNEELINFAFELTAKGTVCQGMTLKVVHIPLGCRCPTCGKTFDFDLHRTQCPSCGSEAFNIEPDAPLLLEEIEFENPAENKDPRER